jgi:hypothetical protein
MGRLAHATDRRRNAGALGFADHAWTDILLQVIEPIAWNNSGAVRSASSIVHDTLVPTAFLITGVITCSASAVQSNSAIVVVARDQPSNRVY